ncbi:TetR/AcrR family transcriptional regulator [Corynebacterium callunae]|uniref:TetR/AcrR family transcriptional regulator n=1 Tax=Corynebacterium callunae TaxID=1721 RepID=UPI003982D047
MSGLREAKKAATRDALARAAAHLALTDGPEALTVATIAASAGVSTRTFHNYFASREEALVEFMRSRINHLIGQLNELPPELGAQDALEHLVISHLLKGDSELDSFSALYHIGEILETLGPPPCALDANIMLDSLRDFFRNKQPGLQDFEIDVSIHLQAAAIASALKWYYRAPEPRDPKDAMALVQRACALLKPEPEP